MTLVMTILALSNLIYETQRIEIYEFSSIKKTAGLK